VANPHDQHFRQLPDAYLRPWLLHEKAEAYKFMINATDPVNIYRMQGQAQLVERMLALLDKEKRSS
jgi:hypothetical protein